MQRVFLVMVCLWGTIQPVCASEFQAGVARVDVSPQEPVRLSGYAVRTTPYEGIDTPLFARTLVLRQESGPLRVLVAVDTIGLPGDVTVEIATLAQKKYGVLRDDLVIASTHSHTAPHLTGGLTNLYTIPQNEEEQAATKRYTDQLIAGVVQSIGQAIETLAPCRLEVSIGEASFAKNRRGVAGGKWIGFNANAGGVVDHTVPCLKILPPEGKSVRAVLFNYACHCTTFGPGHNKVNSDWAGYATTELEAAHPDMLAFCTIGCGADSNPQREGPRQLELSKAQGHELAAAVDKQLTTAGTSVDAPLQSTFGFAGIAPDRPTPDALTKQLKHTQPQYRQHAENMLATIARMGRLPETYPMPIHVWRFGDQFSMVFLGGEVVADYAHRVRKELPAATWVSGYCDDVFGYVASERVRSEGGYEVDDSMIYYNQPGRWTTGTEEVILRRIHELYNNQTPDRALSVEEALPTFSLPAGYEIEVVASEPLIVDPVNFAIAPDGKLWVVEMRDYPMGMDGKGQPGGRIRVLSDTNQDGQYDTAVTFMDQVQYVTGVLPWKDGAWVSASPHISFARDTNGDGQADEVTHWFDGFKDANPQHRVNGFERGLDGWIYVAAGDSTDAVTAIKTGDVVQTSGRDMRFHPITGMLEALGGQTQNARVRDDWGHWFGNTNSEPLMQFPIEDRDLRRNPYVPSPAASVRITDPEVAPPVHPTSRTVDRFNDLWAADRFTSACGTGIFRDQTWGPESYSVAYVCEPVHNLVMRYKLVPHGVTYKAERFSDDGERDFLCSTDNWFRPTRAQTGPDGCLWISDMYRHVIEHPQWIPEAWQARLDVRAGEDKGRIYRIRRTDQLRTALPDLTNMDQSSQLSAYRATDNGPLQDAIRQLWQTSGPLEAETVEGLRRDARGESKDLPVTSRSQFRAIAALSCTGQLQAADLTEALASNDPDLMTAVLKLAMPELLNQESIQHQIPGLIAQESREVRYQVALILGSMSSPMVPEWLGELIVKDPNDSWLQAAILSSAPQHADALLPVVIQHLPEDEARTTWVKLLVASSLADHPEAGVARMLKAFGGPVRQEQDRWRLNAIADTLRVLQDRGVQLDSLLTQGTPDIREALTACQPVFEYAYQLLTDGQADTQLRVTSVSLAGQLAQDRSAAITALNGLFTPQTPIELTSAAMNRLAELGAVEGVIAAWPSLSPIGRREAQALLISRPGTAMSLLQATEDQQIHVSDLDAATRNSLLQSTDPQIGTRAKGLLATTESSTRQAVLQAFQPALALTGDEAHGRVVFEKRCATCHRHREIGQEIGPQLGALQNKSDDYLIRAILDPNQAIESKYTAYVATTKDGRIFTGMIIEETATSLTLARTDGKKDTLLRVDLDELRSTGKSFMPEGLELDITPQDLADLFDFVQGK